MKFTMNSLGSLMLMEKPEKTVSIKQLLKRRIKIMNTNGLSLETELKKNCPKRKLYKAITTHIICTIDRILENTKLVMNFEQIHFSF